ncbi:MAG: tripartite tricarboxylate transporter substrate binding protein [Reyranellaceae bacterium]
MSKLFRRALLAGSAAAGVAAPALVRAQGDWPKGTIRFVVPFPPGGSTDPVARIIQAKLVELTGWNVIVENKPGGAGVVGAQIVAKSPPDGQTWLVVFDSHILLEAFSPNPLPYKDSELQNVMLIGRTPQAIGTPPDRPYKTFLDVADDARKRPGKVSMGVLAASQALVLMTYVNKENKIDLNLIPYKGGGPLLQDSLAGVTDVGISSLTAISPHFRSGKLRPIATTGDKRTPALPDTPTLLEQGIKSYPSYSWWGIYAPAGTPRPIVDRMNAEVTKAVRTKEVSDKFVEQFNMEVLTSSPETFADFQKVEQERWSKIIRDNDIKSD